MNRSRSLGRPLQWGGLGFLCLAFLTAGAVTASDEFRDAEAAAIRQAVDRVAAAVVRIEVVAAAETTDSELAADAPTAGTIIDPAGWILASSLVAERSAASILVVLPDGTRLPAEIVARDLPRELVLLRVESEEPLPSLDLTRAGAGEVGRYAIAVGRLRAEGPPAPSVGIISAMRRLHGRALQIDARISPPFYGGPVVDIHGRLIGITIPALPEAGAVGDKAAWYDGGIAFVAPAEQIVARLERLRDGTTIRSGQLGIVARARDPYAPETEIAAVRVGSPAAEAGLQAGDSILAIDGQEVRTFMEIRDALGHRDAGETVRLTLRREGEELTIEPQLVDEIPTFEPQSLGILATGDDQSHTVVALFPGSPAQEAGLEVGDRIVAIGGQEIEGLDELRRRVVTLRGDEEVELRIERGEQEESIAVTPQAVAGALAGSLPGWPWADPETPWSYSEVALPDVANEAGLLAPEDVPEGEPLGLLVVLAEPGAEDLEPVARAWREAAAASRIAVAVVGSADAQRWTPGESEVLARLVAQVDRRLALDRWAVGITGEGAGQSMALAAALLESGTFRGVAVTDKMRPIGIRVQENDPAEPVQVLVQGGEELPRWGEMLGRAGYAVVTAPESREAVARWIWTLARI